MHMVRLSDRLKQLRQEKHLRQDQVAALLNVTKSAVSSWENDMRQPPYSTCYAHSYAYSRITNAYTYLRGRKNRYVT